MKNHILKKQKEAVNKMESERETERNIPIGLRKRVLFYPIEKRNGEWTSGLAEIIISYYHQTDQPITDLDARSLHCYSKGYRIIAFKHRSEEGEEGIKGFDGICYGIESFYKDYSRNHTGDNFSSEFRPDHIITGFNQEEVERECLEKLGERRVKEISEYRRRGWLVGEEEAVGSRVMQVKVGGSE